MYVYDSTPVMSNCRLRENRAASGAGMYIHASTPVMTSCALDRNEAISGAGGGMYVRDSNPSVVNCSLLSNRSSQSGGGLFLIGSTTTLTLQNSILAYNASYNLYAESYNSATTFIRYNDLYEVTGINHNLASLHSTNKTIEPGFLAYGSDGHPSDLHLATTSGLVNQGNMIYFDVDGTRSDMGGYGGLSGASWDLDGDAFNDWFWPGSLLNAPAGVDPDDYDCNDEDPYIQTCP